MKQWIKTGLMVGTLMLGTAATADPAPWADLGITNATGWYGIRMDQPNKNMLVFVHKDPDSANVYWEILAFRNPRQFYVYGSQGVYSYELRKVETKCDKHKTRRNFALGYDVDGNLAFTDPGKTVGHWFRFNKIDGDTMVAPQFVCDGLQGGNPSYADFEAVRAAAQDYFKPG